MHNHDIRDGICPKCGSSSIYEQQMAAQSQWLPVKAKKFEMPEGIYPRCFYLWGLWLFGNLHQ